MATINRDAFGHHAPTEAQLELMKTLRAALIEYVTVIDANIEDGPDKTYVFQQLRNVGFWVNASVMYTPDGKLREAETI